MENSEETLMQLGNVLNVIADSVKTRKPISMKLKCGDDIILDPDDVELNIVCGGGALNVIHKNEYKKRVKKYSFTDIQSLTLL